MRVSARSGKLATYRALRLSQGTGGLVHQVHDKNQRGHFYEGIDCTHEERVGFMPRKVRNQSQQRRQCGYPICERFSIKLKGKKALELMRLAQSDNSMKRAIGIAVLNALSALLIKERGISGARVAKGADALDVIRIKAGDRVVMVGAFVSLIKKLKGRPTYMVSKASTNGRDAVR
jgi:hypothetical protein